MAQPSGVHMVPERYRKTRFTASCWFYLSQNPQLTFADYQRQSKDRVCRESVFDDVKQSMEMDRLFNNKDAVRLPEGIEPPPRQHPPQPPPPPNLAMKEALTAGLAAAGKQSPKGPITMERRTAAETWIREHLDEGFAQFKGQHPEPELDKAWFDKIRKKALEPAPQPQEIEPMPTATKDKRTKTGDAGRIRDYLAKLPRAKLEDMTGKQYEKLSGHKLKNQASFYAEKKKILNPAYAKARTKREPTRRGAPVPGPARGIMFETLAEIPLVDLKCPAKDLREIVLTLVKALHPRGAEAKVLILAEPPLMEIRVPYL